MFSTIAVSNSDSYEITSYIRVKIKEYFVTAHHEDTLGVGGERREEIQLHLFLTSGLIGSDWLFLCAGRFTSGDSAHVTYQI